LKFPKGAVATSRIGRQRAAFIIPDEIHKYFTASPLNSSSPIPFAPLPAMGHEQRVLCQQSIEDIHFRPRLTCHYFYHGKEDPCAALKPSDLWPNQDDFFLHVLTYLLVSDLGFYLSPRFVPPLRLDLIEAGYGQIPADQLLKEAESISQQVDALPTRTNMPRPLQERSETLVYCAYKAAALCSQGHVMGSEEALESSLHFCKAALELE
jgi:hypothetical protein